MSRDQFFPNNASLDSEHTTRTQSPFQNKHFREEVRQEPKTTDAMQRTWIRANAGRQALINVIDNLAALDFPQDDNIDHQLHALRQQTADIFDKIDQAGEILFTEEERHSIEKWRKTYTDCKCCPGPGSRFAVEIEADDAAEANGKESLDENVSRLLLDDVTKNRDPRTKLKQM